MTEMLMLPQAALDSHWELVLAIPVLLVLGLASLIAFLAPFALWAAIVIGLVLAIRWIVLDAVRLANFQPPPAASSQPAASGASKPAASGEVICLPDLTVDRRAR